MSRIQRFAATVAELVYEAGEGLELVGKAFKIKAASVTNAMIKAAAGIEESKLSLPEVVKKAGEQEITGLKKFNPASGVAISLYGAARTGLGVTGIIEVPLNLGLKAEGIARVLFAKGKLTCEAKPRLEGSAQLFVNAVKLRATGGFEMTPTITLNARPELEGTIETVTTGWEPIAVTSRPTLIGGEGTNSGEVNTVKSGLFFSGTGEGWTVGTYRGFLMEEATGGELAVLTTSVAVDVEDLKKATTNYSLRSVGESVKLKNAGPAEIGKGLGVWGHTPPEAQPKIGAASGGLLAEDTVLLNKIREALIACGIAQE